jgi:hypothetical protein
MIAGLAAMGNQIVATVSNGLCPLGIIDDIRTRSFTNISWNEVITVNVTGVLSGGVLVSPYDIKAELRKPNIIPKSFSSTVEVVLNPTNGVLCFPAGTPLNIDAAGVGCPSGIRTIVNYTYYVANCPGDDSTAGSSRITIWYNRMRFQSDQIESNQVFPLNANLYVSENGLLTTRKPSKDHPSIGFVTMPPSSVSPLIEAIWL